jgi:hypothetical protein
VDPELSLTDATWSRKRRSVPALVWVLLVAFALGGVGFLALPLLKRPKAASAQGSAGQTAVRPVTPPQAVVRIDSVPSGAKVTFDGAPLGQPTPCTLPTRPAGSYPLVLEHEGAQPLRTTLVIPATGEVTLPAFTLAGEPAPSTPSDPATDRSPSAEEIAARQEAAPERTPRHERHPTARARVSVALDSRPSGARLFVNGQASGVTPATVVLPARSLAQVRLELAGYRALSRRIRVGQGPAQEESLRLEAVPAPQPRGTGTVAFVVLPWAEVSCGSYKFGDTPFSDKAMNAGTYQCTFTNPTLGTRRRTVEVRPNARTVVTVKFSDSP